MAEREKSMLTQKRLLSIAGKPHRCKIASPSGEITWERLNVTRVQVLVHTFSFSLVSLPKTMSFKIVSFKIQLNTYLNRYYKYCR